MLGGTGTLARMAREGHCQPLSPNGGAQVSTEARGRECETIWRHYVEKTVGAEEGEH